jgi:hypothetical protein
METGRAPKRLSSKPFLKRFIVAAEVLLGLSGLIDLMLWIYGNYLIPCFTATFFCISIILLLEALRRLI